ncbi:MFS transporter [Luteococcus sp. H138]|uniref:MFS transporter n=1 Tax=unclassified Luteococcus TaxID=2639923 RepID=UPI00313B5386
MRAPSLYRRLFWPILAPSLLIGVAGGATVPVQVLAAMQLGASASLAAAIVAIVGGIGLATTVHAGRLIDRLGDKRAMLLATGVITVFTAVTIAALVWGGRGALALFMAAAFGRAPAMNIWSLARQAYTADHVGPDEVGRAMTALGGTMRIGNLIGPLVGGVLLLWLPLWSVFVLSVLCAVLAVAILYRPEAATMAEPVEAPSAQPLDRLGDHATTTAEPVAASSPSGVRWSRVILAGIAITTLAVARVAQPVIVQLWGVHIGLHESTISLVVAAGAAIEIILMFPGGYLKDRLGRAMILITCLLIYGTGFLLVVPFSAWWGLVGMVLAVVVMAVGNGLGAGVNMTIGADLSPSQGRGRFLGVWALFSNVGVLGGPLLISLLVATVSVQAAVLAIGGIAVAGAAWMTVFAGRIGLPKGIGRTTPR